MATQDCPGANAANADKLAAGCWAEASDGSLLYVKGTENDQTVFELYDMPDPPVYYQDAMRTDAFKQQFSYPPTGRSTEKWLWHDKTAFPWSRVMKTFDKPRPQHADVHETLSAAARVAQSLRLRAHKLEKEQVEAQAGQPTKGKAAAATIWDRLQRACDAFIKG